MPIMRRITIQYRNSLSRVLPVGAAAVFLLSANAFGQSQCGPVDSRVVPGGSTYSNTDYHFTIVVPADATGCAPHTPLPNHGLRIAVPISSARIWVDASYNTIGYRNARAALNGDVADLKSNYEVEKVTIARASLGGMMAWRAVVQISRADGRRLIDERVVAMKPDSTGDGILYTVGFRTNTEDHGRVRSYVDAIMRSFKIS